VTDLAIRGTATSALAPTADAARAFIAASKAPATVKAYRNDWRDFDTWCAQRAQTSLPAASEVIALYLADQAGVKATATLSRRLVSIRAAHRAAGHDDPTAAAVVRETWAGIRRTFGTAQHGKAPARTAELRAMVATLDPETTIGVRDRALLLVGFAAALRRSELVVLDVDDLAEREDGLVVTVRRSKTDQEGAGEQIGVPHGAKAETCPVTSLARWLKVSGIGSGPVFRSVARDGRIGDRLSDRAVALVVKRTAAAAGLDPAQFAGHSLRAGLITSAAEADVHERDIMRQSRHKSIPVMRRYIRGATLFRDNAAAAVGL
jgi:site-specific recombinase XerD